MYNTNRFLSFLLMASIDIVFLFLFVFFFEAVGAQQNDSTLIRLDTSLSPIQSTSWNSPSGRFAFGFYPQGSGFMVGIWLVGIPENITVWTANRDDPPVSSNATLELTIDGKLLLRTEQSEKKLIPDSLDSASSASIFDSGNFVLHNKDNDVIWESFDSPTDTILGGQNLSAGSKLLSCLSKTNYSSGKFRLEMQGDGNLVLYPVNTGTTLDAYWASDTNGIFQYHLYLNNTGVLVLLNDTNLASIKFLSGGLLSYNASIIYRATLDYDGIFRLYSHSFDSKGKYTTSTKWSALKDGCQVKGFCGFNSYCTFNDNEPDCLCLPGSDFADPSQKSNGCERNFTEELCKVGKENAAFYNITSIENIMWYDLPYFKVSMPKEDCIKSCLEDCNCEAALFDQNGYCMKQKLPIAYAKRDTNKPSTAFFKVGRKSITSENDTIPSPMKPQVIVITSKKASVLILVVTLGFLMCSCVALAITGYFTFKIRVVKYRRLLENGNLGLTEELTLRSFSYKELKKATNGFKEELGKGSFGAVYKGTLYKGKKLVAVKRLEKMVNEGEREFQAEMRVIGKTHHRNLVRLLGYCAEDSKRLLVYEYMSNGSLADLLFRAERRPDWNERVRMALDVARGILYLHEECEAPIIHCDIKPQNILMDDFWTAKISDFGLAKLLMPDQTRTFTGVRGTRGYLAPEWQKNTPISVKADIYSYGIVLLEIVCCRRNMEVNVSKPEEIVLSSWVYKCFVARQLEKLVGGEVDKKTLEKMVKVGLWCIQDEPALRPSMKSVVLMLEGITDISIPPCPTTTSI